MTHLFSALFSRTAEAGLQTTEILEACRQSLIGTVALTAFAGLLGLAAGAWLLLWPEPSQTTQEATGRSAQALVLWAGLIAALALLFSLIVRRLQRQMLAVAESRERNRAIVDNMVDGAIHIDRRGRVVALNRAAERIFFRESAEIRGEPVSILLEEPYRDEVEALIREAAAKHRQGLNEARELVGLRGDGTDFPLYIALSEVDIGDQPVFTAITRDLSETRRRLEDLSVARDQAMAADRAKSQFLAVMSHEIRTPMNGILGMLDLLRDGTLSKQQREFIDTAEQSSQMLLGIINDILDLSKIEAGKLELQEIDFDLRAMIEEVTSLTASQARDKDLEVVSYIEPKVPNGVIGDPFRLRQVLLNLTNNAVKFTHQGEVVVHVSADAVSDTEVQLRIRVKDTGIGIEEGVRKLLFRPFSQGDASTTRRFGGTGLGLVISKRLVNLMGGEIDVDSVDGSGSTFWFTVSLRRSAELVDVQDADLSGVRVLVVDDNATNRLILENYLGNWGADSESVDGGGPALRAMQRAADEQRPFALAILDMQMPEMDGIELAQRIKGDPAIADTELLMLSSLGFPGADARRAGIGVSLLKPVRQTMLHEAALKVLGKRTSEGTDKVPPQQRAQFNARVLVAEDNPVNRRVVGLMLGKFGVQTEFANDGREAVQALSEGHRFSLVFMDVHMPSLNGHQATREIREAETRTGQPAVPIIAMTASATAADREACIESGMDDFVSKPVGREALEATLRRWLLQTPLPEPADFSGVGGTAV